MNIRVLIADDHRIVREGLRNLLESRPDIQIVAESETGRETIALARSLQPDIIIMDVTMPDVNGIEATKIIAAELQRTHVIGLSMHADIRFVVEMMNVGASGYLLKDCSVEELVRAIESVLQGNKYISRDISGFGGGNGSKIFEGGQFEDAYPVLTAKEREVLSLISTGMTTKEIAVSMSVSVNTVETHRQNIMNKLDLHTIAELTKYALRRGLANLEE